VSGRSLRILVLNPHLPVFPGGGGVEWLTTRELARLCERVGLVSVAESAEDRTRAASLGREGVELYVAAPPQAPAGEPPRRRPPAPLRAAYRRLVGLSQRWKARGRPLDTVNFDGVFRDMAEGIRDALSERAWHVVSVVQSSAAHFKDRLPPCFVSALVLHDVRARLYARAAEAAGSSSRRRALARQAGLYEAFEREQCRRYDLVVTVSEEDAAWVRERYAPRRLLTLPLPVDAGYFTPAEPEREVLGRIVFTGLMNHPPNADAALFFAREVLPLVRREEPEATFEVVGRRPAPEVLALRGLPGVVVTGEVPDVRPFLAAATVVVAPLRFGSGARQKILEAFAMDKAVVSTPVGAEGLGARAGEHLLVAEGAAGLAESTVHLLRDAGLRGRLRGQGRRLVLETHDPARIGAAYHRRLLEVVAEREREDEPLRVVLDLRWMVPGRAGGLEGVARAFLAHLVEREARDRYVVLVPARCRFDFDLRSRPNVRLVSRDSLGAYLRGAGRAARRAAHRALRLDAYDSPAVAHLELLHDLGADVACSFTGHIEPDLRPLRNVLLVTDIQHEYHPEFFDPDLLRERRSLFGEGLRRADHVCAISEFTRRTLIERSGVPEEKVSVASLAAGPGFRPGPDPADPGRWAALGVEAGYLFFPAHTWLHKNHRAAVDALRLLRDRHGLTPRLVCSGNPRQAQPALEAQISAAGLQGQVHFLGYCPPEDMPALYRGAAALCFPSLFEGFGMPVLEAMASGCPVVCGNRTSLPEVAGEAALLVDPGDPEALADALRRVLTDGGLRQELTSRGLLQASRFSWDQHVREVSAAFTRVRREARRVG
jgi:glycosyltransferase involved in cell wall biosynthesis